MGDQAFIENTSRFLQLCSPAQIQLAPETSENRVMLALLAAYPSGLAWRHLIYIHAHPPAFALFLP